MLVLYNMWMPIYRKGESQFGLMSRSMDEIHQRIDHADKQEKTVLNAAESFEAGQGSPEIMVRGWDAVQELREHTKSNLSVQMAQHDMTIADHTRLLDEQNKDGGIQMGNIKFQEELPISGDDLTRGKVLKEMNDRGK